MCFSFQATSSALTQQPHSQTDQGKKLWIKKEKRCFWRQGSPLMQLPTSPTNGCASPAQRVAGGCLRKHGSQETHAKSLPQEAIVFAPKHLKNLPPRAQSVGPWPGNMDPEGIPGGVLVPFLTAADKNQLSKSRLLQQGSSQVNTAQLRAEVNVQAGVKRKFLRFPLFTYQLNQFW